MGAARAVSPAARFRSLLRALSGLLAGGLVVLALALGVAWVVAVRSGSHGPAPDFLAWHGLAAAVAVIAQRRVDQAPRHRVGWDRVGTAASLGVVGLTAVVLAALWLA